MLRFALSLLLLTLLYTCAPSPKTYEFPRPVDTTTKPIQQQPRGVFASKYLKVDNEFDGARLNGVERVNDTLLRVRIEPENAPINSSPWYAFRLRAERALPLTVELSYPADHKHRYYPKTSTDRITWTPVDSSAVRVAPDGHSARIQLLLPANQPVYLAAQEIVNSGDVRNWLADLADRHPDVVTTFEVGQSTLGRPLPAFTISRGELGKKPTIVLLSRQHPPEVTGFLALQAFLDGLLDHAYRKEFLEQYQVLVYPLLNPDGVDLGHWRHTAGGIDSNRDWAYYRQPEARQIATDIVTRVRKAKGKVVLGMDFHSTHEDVYYTHTDDVEPATALPGFKDSWLAAIERGIGGTFRINEEAEPIGRPTTMSWFRTQFGAEGITYEIGDGTDRTFVRRKGLVSADALVTTLLADRP